METYTIDDNRERNFEDAEKLALRFAGKKLGKDPMLWSWYDDNTGLHSPADLCGDDPREIIERYAEKRGGKLKVLVAKKRYEFCFGSSDLQT